MAKYGKVWQNILLKKVWQKIYFKKSVIEIAAYVYKYKIE